jgi:signal transduction histidine kinase
MSRTGRSWGVPAAQTASAAPVGDLSASGSPGSWAGAHRTVDVAVFMVAAVLGTVFLSPELHDNPHPMPGSQVVVDVMCGVLACLALLGRRRWPLGVAVACLLLGTVSTSATPAGLLSLTSLAVHRPARPTLVVTALWVPALLVFAAYSPTTGPVSVLLLVTPLALAATAWGMFIRARRQLLVTLRDRALRAEADQRMHEDRARMAERTRIAREMHDVLAHRISLMALQAGGLEVRPDLPPGQVREIAQVMRSTARQALEELRGVIGVLREDPTEGQSPAMPQPTLADIGRLVEETQRAGTGIDFEMRVEDADAVPAALGRDAYRIVQEALTNIGKHASGATARVRLAGAPNGGLHISVRNREPANRDPEPVLPGSGAGLLGLQERVALTGGTLVHGPDGSGDFVVEADLRW